MRWILALFPMVILARQAFGIDVQLGSLLSAKNILLYVALLIVAWRMTKEGRLRIEMPAIQGWFLLLIGYAIVTWLVAAFLVKYPNYPVVENGLFLKTLLVDYFLIYIVFFYGPRTIQESIWVLQALLLVVLCVQVVTVGEAFGVLQTALVDEQESGRPEGLIGEANQSAAFAAFFLPAILAMGITTKGLFRVVWIAAALLSAVGFLVLASRGATLGMLVAIFAGTYLLRHRITPGILLRWAGLSAVLLGVGLVLASLHYGDLLYQRFIVDTFGGTVDDASMGRTMLWAQATDKMMLQPLSFLTGFGWRVYWSLPNVLSPHNTYLNLWFNLGVVGVGAYLAMFFVSLRASLRTGPQSLGPAGAQLVAFSFAIICAAATLFFVEWYEPWPYFWAYVGLCMRLALLSEADAVGQSAKGLVAPESVAAELAAQRGDRFGWSATDR